MPKHMPLHYGCAVLSKFATRQYCGVLTETLHRKHTVQSTSN